MLKSLLSDNQAHMKRSPILTIASLALVLSLVAGCGTKPKVKPVATPEQAQYDEGTQLLKSGNVAGAAGAFETAVRLNAGFTPGYLALAELAAKSGDSVKAVEYLESLRRVAPQTPHLYCRLAEVHGISGHFVEALTAAQLAMQKEPDCPRARTQMSLQYAGAGDNKNAIAVLEPAHVSDPSNERIAIMLAQLLARDGRVDEAWKMVDSLPANSALPGQSFYLRAWMTAEIGRNGKKDDKGALVWADKALAVAPDDRSANLEKGKILLRAGNAKSALDSFLKARDGATPSSDLMASVAEANLQLKTPGADKMKTSAVEYAKIIDSLFLARKNYIADPAKRENKIALAKLEARINNGKDAEQLLNEVLEVNPNDAEVLKLMTPDDTVAPVKSGVPQPKSSKP